RHRRRLRAVPRHGACAAGSVSRCRRRRRRPHVLVHYFPAEAAFLDAARSESLDAILDGSSKDDGIAVGAAAAAALIAARQDDGAAPPAFHQPASAAPGEWQLTAGCTSGGVLLHWRDVTPFGIETPEQFRSPPPPPLPSARYANDFDEV